MKIVSMQLFTEGLKYHKAGALEEAERLYRKNLKLHPRNAETMAHLGRVLCDQGQREKGFDFLRKATRAQPRNPAYLRQLGEAQMAAGCPDRAARTFQRAVALAPDSAALHFVMGHAYMAQVNMEQAIVAFEGAHKLEPGNLDYRYTLAAARLRLGELPPDTPPFRALVEARPASAVYHCQLATALRLNNEFTEAEQHYERALALEPGFPEAVGGLAQVYESTGRTEEGARLLQQTIDRGAASITVIVAYARICKRQRRPGDAVGPVTGMLADPELSPFHRMTLLYRLGDLHEELGSYDQAWACYERANGVHTVQWNAPAHRKMIDSVIDTFSAKAMQSLPRSANRSDLPVFVVGMFRSGTSLTEQVLASHPSVFGAGELPDIHRIATTLHETLKGSSRYPKCIRSIAAEGLDRIASAHLEKLVRLGPDSIRVSDKNPINYLHLGLIAILFPGCRIIHCTRHPLDTCVSCYANSFSTAHAYTQNLRHLAEAYGHYRRLMDHWRQVLDVPVMEVRYEDLVSAQERVTRELLEFCGLPFDEACLRFYESRRVLQTLSKDQIRRPVHTNSVGRHRWFEKYLQPLQDGLARQDPG